MAKGFLIPFVGPFQDGAGNAMQETVQLLDANNPGNINLFSNGTLTIPVDNPVDSDGTTGQLPTLWTDHPCTINYIINGNGRFLADTNKRYQYINQYFQTPTGVAIPAVDDTSKSPIGTVPASLWLDLALVYLEFTGTQTVGAKVGSQGVFIPGMSKSMSATSAVLLSLTPTGGPVNLIASNSLYFGVSVASGTLTKASAVYRVWSDD